MKRNAAELMKIADTEREQFMKLYNQRHGGIIAGKYLDEKYQLESFESFHILRYLTFGMKIQDKYL